MTNELLQGLELSLVGLTLTFSGLGLLVILIMVLERLFRQRPLVPEVPPLDDKPLADTLTRDSAEEEHVAAIAVALTHLLRMEQSRGRLGELLEEERGAWWRAGQGQQLRAQARRRR
ncbi:MAG: hypothetical protein D6796_01285 [Caldilineae bacterium]|nr:MAG: hypothetical protein D6796_01285 [Caldilineae bacterium]